jgi:hypothetical protein
VKVGDRVVCIPHSGPKGPGVIVGFEEVERYNFPGRKSERTAWVRVRLDKGGVHTFLPSQVEKETRFA